jgi:hypothetical protein
LGSSGSERSFFIADAATPNNSASLQKLEDIAKAYNIPFADTLSTDFIMQAFPKGHSFIVGKLKRHSCIKAAIDSYCPETTQDDAFFNFNTDYPGDEQAALLQGSAGFGVPELYDEEGTLDEEKVRLVMWSQLMSNFDLWVRDSDGLQLSKRAEFHIKSTELYEEVREPSS